MDRSTLEKVIAEAGHDGVPRLRRGDRVETLKPIAPPAPQASFGYVNDWVRVAGKIAGDAYLVLPVDAKRSGWIPVASLRVFRFDDDRGFEMLPHSRVYAKAGAVVVPVTRAGAYGLIGLHAHPLVRETIRLFCELRPRIGALPEPGRKAFRDRVCDLILCAPDMRGFLESRAELDSLIGQLCDDAPDGMPPLLSRPAHPGETICERCHGAGGFLPEIPECHILEEPAARPCRAARWENIGPWHISGVIRQIAIDPNVPRRLYAVSANGGIWRLGDKDDYPHTRWRPITERETNLRFRVMAIAPSDSTVLYAANSTKTRPFSAATVRSEIYVSTNFGLDWGHPIEDPAMGVVHRLVVHPHNPDVVFAATSEGFWVRSVAGGAWTLLFDDDCLDVAMDPDDPSILYLGVRNRGLFKSFTSGATWSIAPILDVDPVAAGEDPTRAGDQSGSRQTIKIALGRRSHDDTIQSPLTRTVVARFGNQINVHQAGGDDPAGWLRVVPSQIVPNTGTDSATRPNIDRQRDALAGGNERRSDTSPMRGNEWCQCLAVDPFDADHIFAGGTGLLESTNGGQDWSLRGGLPHEDEHSMVFDEREKGVVYLANDGGLFRSTDGGATWPSMSFADSQANNLAVGLITSELKRTALRRGRCLTAIDHTGFVLTEHLDDPDHRWQFLFADADNSNRHANENSSVFACPASVDRYYAINNRKDDDPTGVQFRLVQFDFTRTGDLVDAPAFNFLTTGLANDLPVTMFDDDDFFPDVAVYDSNKPGPVAIRFVAEDDERLILFGSANPAAGNFAIQSLRLPADGIVVSSSRQEGTTDAAVCAIAFEPPGGRRAFAITRTGRLLERDFADPGGTFTEVSQFALGAAGEFPRILVPVRQPELRVFALSQTRLERYDDDGQPMSVVFEIANPESERLIALAAHPSREGTLFLGTTRGVYLSESDGASWTPYRSGMPSVPVTQLIFDQGFLYAATYGRGLWRCKPCP
jgi:hypothetical protein